MASWTTRVTGGRWGFGLALGSVIIWLLAGPFFKFSELWQLIMNTATSIITFLMVFLIQNAQNRESKAIHLKLDELLFSVKSASNTMISIESLNEEQLDQLAERYRRLAERYQHVAHPEAHGVAEAMEQRVEQEIRETSEPLMPHPAQPRER